MVLIPYLQGSLFRLWTKMCGCSMSRLNPLSTGKSVQTNNWLSVAGVNRVLIPYLQGSLFRLYLYFFLL